jgi:hypothetical protein
MLRKHGSKPVLGEDARAEAAREGAARIRDGLEVDHEGARYL